MLEGLINIMEERIELCLEGEPVPYGGLFDAVFVLRDHWRQTGVSGFDKWN